MMSKQKDRDGQKKIASNEILCAYYSASNLSLGYARCRWFVGAEEMTVWLGGRNRSGGGGEGGERVDRDTTPGEVLRPGTLSSL